MERPSTHWEDYIMRIAKNRIPVAQDWVKFSRTLKAVKGEIARFFKRLLLVPSFRVRHSCKQRFKLIILLIKITQKTVYYIGKFGFESYIISMKKENKWKYLLQTRRTNTISEVVCPFVPLPLSLPPSTGGFWIESQLIRGLNCIFR